jgi:hypothetical protein
MKHTFLRTCCIVFALILPHVRQALAVVDQQNVQVDVALGLSNVGAGNVVDWAQTFTVGLTGSLVGVDLWVTRYEVVTLPLLFDIRRAQGGKPTEADSGANILASAALPANMIPIFPVLVSPSTSFSHIDLTRSPVPVKAGDILAIVLRSDDPGIDGGSAYSWHNSGADAYPGGGSFLRLFTVFAGPGTFDQNFRTYVDPVPEPSTWLLVLGAVSLLLLRRRSR